MTLCKTKAGLSHQTRRSCRAPYATIKKRGVLAAIFEALGLNGCLADDMDWESRRKIVRLVNEKESMQSVPPTLLIAPTSVVGNWLHEIAKFAPHLQAMVHHGSDRIKQSAEFKQASRKRCCYHLIGFGKTKTLEQRRMAASGTG